MKSKEEDLVGMAVKQSDALRSLQEQKDETVKTLLTGADVLKNESADENKHEKEEEKDEKVIASELMLLLSTEFVQYFHMITRYPRTRLFLLGQ